MNYWHQVEHPLLLMHHNESNQIHDDYQLHCHDRYEIYYFIRGHVSYLVEGKHYTLAPHTILLLAPRVFHGMKVHDESNYERWALHFSPELLSIENRRLLLKAFRPLENQGDICYENVRTFGMERYFEDLLSCAAMSGRSFETALRIRMENLLLQLRVMADQTKQSVISYEDTKIEDMIRYLNRHLCQNITLEELSKKFYLSKNMLNYHFKKATGTTIVNYIIHKRLALSRELISDGTPVQTAALKCGFTDYTAYFKAYKRIYKEPPSTLYKTMERKELL